MVFTPPGWPSFLKDSDKAPLTHVSSFSSDCILIVYTDNCLIFGPSTSHVQLVIQWLQQTFLMKDEGKVKDFLGICVACNPQHGTITLTQPGLINSVLQDLGFLENTSEKVQPKFTPASSILHQDQEGLPWQEHWHYCTVIGKLNFIAANTHPDISFAVHQCAKFSNQPHLLHEKAVKHIGQYLYFTRHQGMILWPKPNHSLNTFAYADFAGRWHQAYSHLHNSTLSCTGYVLVYCGCPISWTSKLQTEITLSMTEAEYQALSPCMHDLLPWHTLIQELAKNSFINQMYLHGSILFTNNLKSTVYSDNQSCLTIACSVQVELFPLIFVPVDVTPLPISRVKDNLWI